MEVQVRSKKLVKPSSPTPPELQKWKLSFIDQKQPFGYLTVIFYYQSDDGMEGVPARIRRLEGSLSETLTLFYPLAGRIDEEGEDPVVNCNDQGVEFAEAKVNWKLDQHLLDGGASSSGMITARSFNPVGIPRGSLPLIDIQVNIFECGGLAISVQCNHAVCDAAAALTFINQWAVASRDGILKTVRPSFDLGSIFPVQKGPKDLFPSPSFANMPNVRLRRFVFNSEAMSRLKAEVMAVGSQDGGSHQKRPPSRVELVMSFISKVLASIDRERHGEIRPLVVIQAVTLRGRLRLPVPENSFGNVYFNWMSPPIVPGERSGPELMRRLIDSIRNGWVDAVDEFNKIEDPEALRPMMETGEEKMFEFLSKGDEVTLSVFSSWSRLPIYTVDFGWGAPSFASQGQTLPGSFYLMDTKGMDGINVWVTLEDAEMETFENHPDILAHASQS